MAGESAPYQEVRMTTVHTFGDSVLDCARYNDHGVTPAALLARNDDTLFPAFRGRDVATLLAAEAPLVPRATDGVTVADLRRQLSGHRPADGTLVMLTIGGNDLLQGLAGDTAGLPRGFERELRWVLGELAHTDLFVGNVYDPSFGDDSQNSLHRSGRRSACPCGSERHPDLRDGPRRWTHR